MVSSSIQDLTLSEDVRPETNISVQKCNSLVGSTEKIQIPSTNELR